MNLIIDPSDLMEEAEKESSLVQMPSGILVPQTYARETILKQRRITGVDVFCGAGGFTLGAIQAGIKVVAGIEYDTTCVMTYMCNLCRWGQVKMHFIEPSDEERLEKALTKTFKQSGVEIKDGEIVEGKGKLVNPPMSGQGWINSEPSTTPGVSHIVVGDVRKLSGQRFLEMIGMEFGEIGCMMGGPPCQGFSTAGKRNVYDPRNSLVMEYARLIVETSPKTCVMENVPGILTMTMLNGVPVVDRFTQILRDGGFHGADAIDAMLRAPNRVAAIRDSSKKSKTKKKVSPEKREKPKQRELF